MIASFTSFVLVSLIVIVTPGRDTALTIRNTIMGGRAAGLFTALLTAAEPLRRTIEAMTGVVLIGLGLRIVAERQ